MAIVSINGINLYYKIKGQGHPILFLHGLGSSSIDWDFQFSFFSKEYKTLAPDLRGHGRSSKANGPYSIKLFASDTAKLIKILSINSVHIVGISLGGMVGLQLAVDFPDLVKSLVVVNSPANYSIQTPKDMLLVYYRIIIVKIFGMKTFGKILSKRLFPSPDQKKLRSTFVERWSKNNKQCYLNTFRAIIEWDITPKLKTIFCPTLIVTADNDYTPISRKTELASKISYAKLAIIKNSRHASPVDQPFLFNQTVNNFLHDITS